MPMNASVGDIPEFRFDSVMLVWLYHRFFKRVLVFGSLRTCSTSLMIGCTFPKAY